MEIEYKYDIITSKNEKYNKQKIKWQARINHFLK